MAIRKAIGEFVLSLYCNPTRIGSVKPMGLRNEKAAMNQRQPMMNVVLFQPEIPQNTGNIGRTCVALEAKLWIVRPTGFRLDDKALERAGLDYWQHLDWQIVDSWDAMKGIFDPKRAWFFTKFGQQLHTDVTYQRGDWLVFGTETSGLPERIRSDFASQCLRLPMTGPVRSLNLAVAAGIGMYELFRQCGNPTTPS